MGDGLACFELLVLWAEGTDVFSAMIIKNIHNLLPKIIRQHQWKLYMKLCFCKVLRYCFVRLWLLKHKGNIKLQTLLLDPRFTLVKDVLMQHFGLASAGVWQIESSQVQIPLSGVIQKKQYMFLLCSYHISLHCQEGFTVEDPNVINPRGRKLKQSKILLFYLSRKISVARPEIVRIHNEKIYSWKTTILDEHTSEYEKKQQAKQRPSE